jgi:hypothetical protein
VTQVLVPAFLTHVMTMLLVLMRGDTLNRTAALNALAQFKSPKKSSALRPDKPVAA